MIANILLIAFTLVNLVLLGTSQNYNVGITITCTAKDENGVCTTWTQTGTLTQDVQSGSCFPSSTRVLRDDGTLIQMDQLFIGDRILAHNQQKNTQEFTEVTAWLHRDVSIDVFYKQIQTASDILWVSADHNIAILVDGQIKYVHASEVKIGDILVSNANEIVVDIKNTILQGAYAPYTALANFYVGTENATYLVHSFAYINNPTWYEYPFSVAMWISRYIPSLNFMNEENKESQYFHPMAHLLYGAINPLGSVKRFSSGFSRSFTTGNMTGQEVLEFSLSIVLITIQVWTENNRKNRDK